MEIETTIKEIIRDTLMVVASDETLKSITNDDINKLERKIIDNEDFNDLVIKIITDYLDK